MVWRRKALVVEARPLPLNADLEGPPFCLAGVGMQPMCHTDCIVEPYDKGAIVGPMQSNSALWLANPLGILGEAPGGVVVQDGRIVELLAAGAQPSQPAARFDASRHVVLPGLINTHHHFYQTLTRCYPPALDRTLFDWLGALYPIWARLTPEALEAAATVALAELLLSGCTTTTDHHYVFPRGGSRTQSPSRRRRPGGSASVPCSPGDQWTSASATVGCRPTAWCRTPTPFSSTAPG